MSDHYSELLDATIEHLKVLKSRGVKYVPVTPGTLAAFSSAAKGSASPARPAAPRPAPVAAKPAQVPVVVPIVAAEAAPLLSKAEKEAGIEALRVKVMSCVKCANLASSRTTVVFGVGDIHSPLMFVGEAPGADEDLQGEPFVGKAGQLLTKIIQTMGLSRETVFIANILKCRPDTPGQTAGNRKPTVDEMKTCLPYLEEQIRLIQPKVIVTLGATAVEGVLGAQVQITKFRGQWQAFEGIPVMPTYHPSYLLRNQSLSLKREIWEDMLQVLEKLNLPITEKQRGFFLAPG